MADHFGELIEKAKKEVEDLNQERTRLEQEAGDIVTELESAASGSVGLHGSLVDADGFPRADIDHYAIKRSRQRHICIQNDHMEVMENLKKAMERYYTLNSAPSTDPLRSTNNPADAAASLTPNNVTMDENETSNHSSISALNSVGEYVRVEAPFATVKNVAENSPAAAAGLQEGDHIIRFHTLKQWNPQKLLEIVKERKDRVVDIVVTRQDDQSATKQRIVLQLTPQAWNGQGLLGCLILSLT